MSQKPLLSIITINYNNAPGLDLTMKSVFSQSFQNYEYIIIDGGSTDGSTEVIKKYLSIPDNAEKVAYWVSEKDKGIYNAMNKGISKASGNFLYFLNSGDYLINENILERLTNECDFTRTNTVYYGHTENRIDDKVVGISDSPDFMTLDHLYRTTISHQSSFISKDVFIDHLYSEEYKLVSDWKHFFEAFLNGTSFIHTPAIIAVYDLTGISSNNMDICGRERTKILSEILPAGIRNDIQKRIVSPLSSWNYYGQCFYQNERIYRFQLSTQKVIFKLLRMLRILKRIDQNHE